MGNKSNKMLYMTNSCKDEANRYYYVFVDHHHSTERRRRDRGGWTWWMEMGGDTKKLQTKLESIKAVVGLATAAVHVVVGVALSFLSAMIASAFFAITRFLENFDEPFHNSRSHTRFKSL